MTLLFDGKFQGTEAWISRNGIFGNWNYSCLVRANSVSVSGDTATFTANPGDTCNGTAPSIRAMVIELDLPTVLGQEYWFADSFMLPNGVDPTTWNLFVQSKPTTGNDAAGTNPMWAVNGAADGRLIFAPCKIVNNAWTLGASHTIGNIVPGVWYNILIRAVYSTSNTGLYEIWADGVLKYSEYNIQNHLPGSVGTHFDIGYYGGGNNPVTASHKNAKVGTTRSDVEITSSSEPTIIISPIDGGTVQTVKDGINTIFTAIPAEGYVFDHFNDVWTNNNQNFYVNPWTDAASSADTITAFFVYIPPPVPTTSHLSVSIKGGQGAIMMDGDPHAIYQTIETDLPIGYNLILEGVPAQDNVFHHWYDIVNAAETTTNPITLQVTTDMVFELYFGYVAPPPPPPPPPPPQPQDAGGAAFMVIGGYLILKATGVIK